MPKLAGYKKRRVVWFTPGELTWIKGYIRGTIKTAAVPSVPALIARDSQGLSTELFTEHSTVTRSVLSGSTEKHVLCAVCIWHSGQSAGRAAPHNLQSDGLPMVRGRYSGKCRAAGEPSLQRAAIVQAERCVENKYKQEKKTFDSFL